MILMYHHVCPVENEPADPERRRAEGWDFAVTPGQLEHHITTIRSRGFEFVSLADYLRFGHQGHPRPVVATFDDGWLDNFEYALPVLIREKVPATFFLVSGEMAGVPARSRMNDLQIEELIRSRQHIGAHTRSHPSLPRLSAGELERELSGGKLDLEQRYNVPIEHLAYPGGAFNLSVAKAAEAAGYTSACSTIPGGRNTMHSRFWLYREMPDRALKSLRMRLLFSTSGELALRLRASALLRRRLTS